MPPAIPNYDLGILITFNIAITVLSIFVAVVGLIILVRQANANATYLAEMAERSTRSSERVAEIAERIDARFRRQFPDIGEELGD